MTAFHLRGTSPYLDADLLSVPPGSRTSRQEAPARAGVFGRAAGALVAGIWEYFHRRRVMSELFRLSDRELADIGLSRSEIGLIYSEEFAARHNAERLGG